jgi:CBS domain containing-hemolysin-like protein
MSPELALLAAILLLLGNAFFVGAEFSMVSVRRSAIEPEAAKGSKRAQTTLRALDNVAFLMAGAQLGITLCSLGLGAVAEPAIAHLLESPFQQLGFPDGLLHPLASVIALAVTVFFHVVIGEMVPKNIALAKPERSALILTPMLVYVVRVLDPVVRLLNTLANQTLKLFNIRPQAEVSSTYTRDEMADLVKESRREGYLSEDNEQLLSGALTFDAQTVRDIAVPAEQMVTIGTAATYEQVEQLASETGYSRFPVTDRNQKMLGYVHIKDIIKVDDSDRHKSIRPDSIRKLATVDADQSIRMTLKIMQHSGAHIALVTSGKTLVGTVTLEDVLEELVGEMRQQPGAA